MTLSEKIDARVAAKRVLDHPFYQAWNRGELTLEALRDYAKQYYKHVQAFPTYLSAVHAHTEDATVRRHLLQNLVDEEAGHPNHPELWLQFAEALGVGAEEAHAESVQPETARLIDDFRSTCLNESVTAGVAALYTYESQIPEVSETKIEGLKRFYGMDDPAGYHYFTVHIEADKEHAEVERAMIDSLAFEGNELDENEVLEAVDRVLDNLYGLLSGVCERHDIPCDLSKVA